MATDSKKKTTTTTSQATGDAGMAFPGLDAKALKEQYAFAYNFFKSDPSLWKLYEEATTTAMSSEMFQAKLKNTAFYKKHSQAQIDAIYLQKTQPKEWQAKVGDQVASLRDLASGMGADLSDSAINAMAVQGLMNGWNAADWKDHLAGTIQVVKDTGHYGGEAGQSEDSLRKLGMDYGQKISPQTLQNWVVNIARGDTTVQDFKAQMQKQAEVTYPAYSEQIKKGMTMSAIAQPYMQMMADTLELNPDNIDIFDKHIQGALSASNADSNKKGEYSMYDFQTQLRQDPRWSQTKNAQDTTSGVANAVLKSFGFS